MFGVLSHRAAALSARVRLAAPRAGVVLQSRALSHEQIPYALTFDDVLLVPKRSPVRSRKDVSLRSRLTRNLSLAVPIVSSNMDTVTEHNMAVAMAQLGGIGILHRFLSIEDQVEMVRRVKRAESHIITNPYSVKPTVLVKDVRWSMEEKRVGSFLVVDDANKLIGLVSGRDVRWAAPTDPVSAVMTPRSRLIVGHDGEGIEAARSLIIQHRLEKLPLVDAENNVRGLVTARDLMNIETRPYASMDARGQLLVGAAVGVKSGDMARADALISAGCDVLVIDIAHGHSDLAIDQTRALKQAFPKVDVIAGNVASGEAVRDLVHAGADGVKVGVGPGSICITRIVTGCGVPQLSAVLDCARVARELDVPLIADGGIRGSGDIVKALAAGAETVMLGSMLAGTDQSPGTLLTKDGKKVKIVRGMAGWGANLSKAEREKMRTEDVFEMVPEGVEAVVPYRGSVRDVVHQLAGGVRSGISYCGARDIKSMQQNAEFVRITPAGLKESGSHDVAKL